MPLTQTSTAASRWKSPRLRIATVGMQVLTTKLLAEEDRAAIQFGDSSQCSR